MRKISMNVKKNKPDFKAVQDSKVIKEALGTARQSIEKLLMQYIQTGTRN